MGKCAIGKTQLAKQQSINSKHSEYKRIIETKKITETIRELYI